MTVIIIIAVLAVLVLCVISVQRKLVQLDEFSKNALKQINVQQMSRYDALTTMVEMAREYALDVESKTIIEAIGRRRPVQSANPTVDQINQNEQLLNQARVQLNAVAERYPELTSAELYEKAQKTYAQNEDQVRLSRMTFNDTVTRFNTQVRMFPGSLVAGPLGFTQKAYLEEDKEKADLPKDLFRKRD